jgi:hypothetical protein
VSQDKGVGKYLLEFANCPTGAHPKNKVWPSKVGVGYEADNLIPEKMLTFISLKENGWNDYGKRPCEQGKDMDLVM